MSEYEIHVVDDWAVLYKDGKAVLQGHSIEARDLAYELKIPYESHEGDEVDDQVMRDGKFPSKLSDLKEVT